MSDISTDLTAYLNQRKPLKKLVGARIYPDQAPHGTPRPYVVYALTSSERPHHMGGASGLVNAVFQFDVYSDTRSRARAIADGIRSALDGYQLGAMTEIEVRSVTMSDWRDDILTPGDGGDRGIYNANVDFSIWYRETIPAFPAS